MMRSKAAAPTGQSHQFAFLSHSSGGAYAATRKSCYRASPTLASTSHHRQQPLADRNPTSTISPYAQALKQVALRGSGGVFGPSSKELDLRLYAKNMLPADYKSPVQGKWDDTVERWAYAWQFPNAEDEMSATGQRSTKGYSFQLAESCGRIGRYSPLAPLVELAEYIRKNPKEALLSEVRQINKKENETAVGHGDHVKENIDSFIKNDDGNMKKGANKKERYEGTDVYNDASDVAGSDQVGDIIKQVLVEGYAGRSSDDECTTIHSPVSEEESFLDELSFFNPNSLYSGSVISAAHKPPIDVLRASLLAHGNDSEVVDNVSIRGALDMLPASATVPLLPHQVPPGIPRAYTYDGSTLSQLSILYGTILMEGLELPFDEDGIELALYSLTYACQMHKRVDIRSSIPHPSASVQSNSEDSMDSYESSSLVSISISKQHIRAIFELTKVLGFKLNPNLYNALLYVDAHNGNITPVMNVIEEMKVDGITPSKDTWHLLMVGFIKAKDYSASVQVVDNMKAYANLEPDETTFALHLYALACDKSRESSVSEAIQLFDTMENVYMYIASRPHYHSLMAALATKKSLDARDRIEMLGKKMELLGIPWSASTFNIQLRSAQLFGDIKAVKRLFAKARNEGISPTPAMYAWTIRSYGNHMLHIDYETEYLSVSKSPVEYWNNQLKAVFGIYELLCEREDPLARDWLKEKAAQVSHQIERMEKYGSRECSGDNEEVSNMEKEEELAYERLENLQDQLEGSHEVHVTSAVIDALLYVCSSVTSLALTHLGNDDGGDESSTSKNNFIAMQYEAQSTAIWDTFYARHQDRLDEMECFIGDRLNSSYSGDTHRDKEYNTSDEYGGALGILSSPSRASQEAASSAWGSSRPCAKKTIYSYQIYIQLLCKEQRLDEAEKLFQELILSDSSSNRSYFNAVHNSHVSEVVPTPRTYEALMMGHLASGEEGGTARALQYLEAMEKNKMHISARLLKEFVKVNNEAGYKRDMKRRARRIMQAREEYMTRVREYEETEKRNYARQHQQGEKTSADSDVTTPYAATVKGEFTQEKTPFEQMEDAPILLHREVIEPAGANSSDSKLENEPSYKDGDSIESTADTQSESGVCGSALVEIAPPPSSLSLQSKPPTSSLEWWEQWRKTSISKHELFDTEREDGMPRGASNEERIYALKALGVPNPSDLKKDHHHHKNKLLPLLRKHEGEVAGSIWAMDGGELSYPKDGQGPESWGVKLWRERRLITKEYNKAMEGYSNAVSGALGGVMRHTSEWATVRALGTVSTTRTMPDGKYSRVASSVPGGSEGTDSLVDIKQGIADAVITEPHSVVNVSQQRPFSPLGVVARSAVDQLAIIDGGLQDSGQLADLRQYPHLTYDDGTMKASSEVAIGGELAVSPSAELVWKHERSGDPLSPYRTNDEIERLNNAISGGIGLGGSLGEEATFFTDSVLKDAHQKAHDAVAILKRKEEAVVDVSSSNERKYRLSKRSTHDYLDKWKEMYSYGSLEAADEPLVSFGRDEYVPGEEGVIPGSAGSARGGTPKAHHRETMSKTIKSWAASRRRSRGH